MPGITRKMRNRHGFSAPGKGLSARRRDARSATRQRTRRTVRRVAAWGLPSCGTSSCWHCRCRRTYGCIGVVVDAKHDAADFYARLGFSPLEIGEGEIEARPKPTPLFLPLELVAAALVP
jgi:hypothetical protein